MRTLGLMLHRLMACVRTCVRSRAGAPTGVAAGVIVLSIVAGIGGASCQTTPRGARVSGVDEPDVRVRIVRESSSVRIGGPERIALRPVGSIAEWVVVSPVSVRADAGGLVAIDATGVERRFDHGVGVEARAGALAAPARSSRRAPAQPDLRIDDRPYPGVVEVHPRSDASEGALDVINVLSVEAYLPGVLSGELYNHWPLEAYRAQAVCARSYALHERARARARGRAFDIESTARSQVFAGRSDHETAVRAVRDTRGRVLTDGGQVVRAYYSSTCGGRPVGAASIWPTGTGWEFNAAPSLQVNAPRAAFCESSPAYRWQVTRTIDDVSRRLVAYGRVNGLGTKSLGRVRSIGVAEVNAAGRPVRYTIADEKGGSATLNAEHLRQAMNFADDSTPAPERAALMRSGDAEFEFRGREVVIRGRGWGHGVGACQFCMHGMAGRHWDHQRMLAHFYPGARVVQKY